MRTTLTIDDDAARLIEAEVRRRRTSVKEVINDAIRRGLAKTQSPKSNRVQLKVFSSKLAPGFDSRSLNRLVDELEVDDQIKNLKRE